MSQRARLLPLLPPFTLGLHAVLSGNFHSGARAWPSLWGWIAIALLSALGAEFSLDLLRLRRAAALPWLGWSVMAISGLVSPVPRAGSTAILLAPLVLLMPAGVARCWRTASARRLGLIATAAVVTAVSAWALLDRLAAGSPRSAMPLGHHNLLALWLLMAWPLGVAAARQRRWRWLGGVAGATALGALLLTDSLAAAVGLGAQLVVVGAMWGGRLPRIGGRRVLLALAALIAVVLAWQTPRVAQLLLGEDPSTVIRLGYLRAGLKGWLERPLLGWGPGSSSWTLSEHLASSPPYTPPHQVVSDLHSLPAEVLYELGLLGLAVLLATIIAWVTSRWREWRARSGRDAMGASCALGLIGVAFAAPLAGLFDVLALYVAAAVIMGGMLASGGVPWRRTTPLLALVVILLCLGLWSPRWLAQLEYGRYVKAVVSGVSPSAEHAAGAVHRAAALDPQQPLYRSLLADAAASAIEAMEEAGRAAWTARGVSALWIREAMAAASLDPPRAARALETACDLDPLGGFAPFLQLQLDPRSPLASERGARALLAEPRLAAAGFWSGRERLLSEAVDRLVSEEAIDPGWREAADRQLRWSAATGAPPIDLSLQIDGEGETSLSLFVFRRQQLPRSLVTVGLAAGRLERIELPPYFELVGSTTEMLKRGCRLR